MFDRRETKGVESLKIILPILGMLKLTWCYRGPEVEEQGSRVGLVGRQGCRLGTGIASLDMRGWHRGCRHPLE